MRDRHAITSDRRLPFHPRRTAGRGPGPARGGFVSGSAFSPRGLPGPLGLCPNPSGIARLRAGPRPSAISGPLFAHFASPLAPGPLPLRGSAPARRARRRFAGPVRRSAPSLRSPGPPLPAPAAASPLGPCLRACALGGLSLPPGGLLPIRSAAGSLIGRPCFSPGRCAAAVGRRFLSPAPSGLRGRLAPARGRSPLTRALVRSAAPGVGCRAGVRRLAYTAFSGCSGLWSRC